jgi:hypothetical protein
MQNKISFLVIIIFTKTSITIGILSYYFSKNPGSLLSSFFLGVLGGWAAIAQ